MHGHQVRQEYLPAIDGHASQPLPHTVGVHVCTSRTNLSLFLGVFCLSHVALLSPLFDFLTLFFFFSVSFFFLSCNIFWFLFSVTLSNTHTHTPKCKVICNSCNEECSLCNAILCDACVRGCAECSDVFCEACENFVVTCEVRATPYFLFYSKRCECAR